jgi:general secretion pathway protein J
MISMHSNKGFTLIELLITVTIIGLIVVIISGALRVGVKAWEKGEKDVETNQRTRIVLDLLKRQLTSSSFYVGRNGPGSSALFQGNEKSLEFVCPTPLMPENKFGLVYVKYLVRPGAKEGTERLVFYEKNRAFINGPDDLAKIDPDAYSDLIPEAEGIEFAYLVRLAGKEVTYEWKQSWDAATLPLAVRISLKQEGKEAAIEVIARIESQALPYSALDSGG